MNNTGFISLIYDEEIIKHLHYHGRLERNEIIETWRQRYGKRFNECVLQIRLYEGPGTIKEQERWGKKIDKLKKDTNMCEKINGKLLPE